MSQTQYSWYLTTLTREFFALTTHLPCSCQSDINLFLLLHSFVQDSVALHSLAVESGGRPCHLTDSSLRSQPFQICQNCRPQNLPGIVAPASLWIFSAWPLMLFIPFREQGPTFHLLYQFGVPTERKSEGFLTIDWYLNSVTT